ncbi:hypothetical protein MKX01_040369 [Papaver californicum]|nr:hypothetical protein MKX01_040369 [Papaver californicum]
MNLLTLQHKMKIDSEGYETELALLYKHFDSFLFLFQQQSALSFSSINGDPTLSDYPCKLADLLRSSAQSLPSSLRCHLTKALILLINRKFVDIGETLGLFMELQTLGDRTLRKDAFSHKHKNETQNRPLQNILFTMLQAHHKGTLAGKKKKQAKLQRSIRSMKRQQRANSEKDTPNYYSPLNHLIDAQGFAENLFSRLQTCNERFEVKMMILKVIARTVGLHGLILLNFYPFLQKYVQPHQRDITELLASAVQACHDMVPPDAVEPLFRQVVNQFAIAVGLNVVMEICLRIPLLMTEDLLQDLVLYRKSHEKAISTAARSLITLFREVCPSLLVKKDRGRPTNPKARPNAFGEVNIASNVSGLELLQNDDGEDEENDGEDEDSSMFDNDEGEATETTDNAHTHLSEEDNDETEESDVGLDDDNESDQSEEEESDSEEDGDGDEDEEQEDSNKRKRKLSDYAGELNADTSLRALKRIAESTREFESSDLTDGILSNEDFTRIKELKAKEGAKLALGQHGLFRKGPEAKSPAFKVPSSEELSLKRVNPSVLETNIRRKMTKEERLELVKAGREDRGKCQTGGTSNKQKEHKKNMPMVAKRAKIVRSRQERKRLNRIAGKQFRGKKAWK